MFYKLLLLTISIFLFINVTLVFADIVEDQQNPNLSVLAYQEISASKNSDGNLTKEVRLQIKNTGDSTLFNLKMNMRLVPNNVRVVKGDLYFGDVIPGEIVLSTDTVKYIINTTSLNNGEIPVGWTVEFEDDSGKQMKNESIIIEKINK